MINRESATFKRTYAADMALFRVPLAQVTIVAIVLFVYGVFPLFASDYVLNLANLVMIASVGAIGLNILVGYTGQISLGHGGFMSVGAYTAAVLISRYAVPWWAALPVAAAVAAVLGMVIGIPSLRIKGLYLAIATLAAQLMIEWVINHVPWISGGVGASVFVHRPILFGSELSGYLGMYYFILVALTLGIVFALNLFRTHIGRGFIAVRDRDIAAEIIGVNIFRAKLTAFAISSGYAGVTGVLYAYYYGVANYESFTLGISVAYLAMIIIGGLGSVLGSIFGAMFITLLPIALDLLLRGVGTGLLGIDSARVVSVGASLQLMMFGGLIMFFLVVEPDGLNRLWNNVRNYFRVWPFPYL